MTETSKEPILPRKPRSPQPWTEDFQGVSDRLGSALGCQVIWYSEYGEIHSRLDGGEMSLLVSGLATRRDAYFWMLGRLSAELEVSDE